MTSSDTRSTAVSAPPTPAETVDTFITVRDWLRWGVSRFNAAGLVYGHGTTDALDEAAFLILETLHLPVDQLEPWLDARLTIAERRALHDILTRRIETRLPAPYLTGTAYIQGHRFHVDARVIVPRSYLGEMLCQGLLATVLPVRIGRVLDLCTGSGCLAILATHIFDEALVDATDLSVDALEVAGANIAAHDVGARVRLLAGDLFASVAGERYDLILANPPYVAAAEVAAFAPEYAAEPPLAHLGGADGLDLVRRIIADAARHLTPDGVLVMEIGTGRALFERAWPTLEPIWLDSAASEGEVLALSRRQLEGAAKPQRRKARG